MKLMPTKKPNVKLLQTDIKPEWTLPPVKFLNQLLLLKLLDREKEPQKKTSLLVKDNLSCLTIKKLPPEPKENKTQPISMPDKNKLNSFLTLLKLLFQNLKLSLHTVLLKLSWNLPNSELPIQSPLQLKLLLPLTEMLLPDVSDYQKNFKLISLPSSMVMLKPKSKQLLPSITS